jgi:hypothetical protein
VPPATDALAFPLSDYTGYRVYARNARRSNWLPPSRTSAEEVPPATDALAFPLSDYTGYRVYARYPV